MSNEGSKKSSAPGWDAQLPLGIRLTSFASFDNYVQGPNGLAVDSLLAMLGTSWTGPGVYLSGGQDSGKSHLLQSLCRAASYQQTRRSRAAYLPLMSLVAQGPACLEGLDQQDLVCIDDLQVAAGDLSWEEALFNLYNRLQSAGIPMVVSALVTPQNLSLRLPDLRSRLSALTVCVLQPLMDEDRITALRMKADQLGLELPEVTARYLLNRQPRALSKLMGLLDYLDGVSLVAQRRLTVPFVQEVLRNL